MDDIKTTLKNLAQYIDYGDVHRLNIKLPCWYWTIYQHNL